jgi:hypothetical protein
MVPAEMFEVRELVLTLSLAKPRYNVTAVFEGL